MINKKLTHRITDIFYKVNMLEGAIPVVREDGMFVIRNFVIIRAGRSDNRNYYPVNTLRRDHKVFEGVQIRTNHPEDGKAPSVKDIVGKAENLKFSESDKTIRADAVFSSVEGDLVTKIKENLIGDMSINAFGIASMEKGRDGRVQRRISSITAANSVDLVCEASAGGTLHEEKRQASLICERMVETMDELEKVTIEELKASRPDLVEAIQKKAVANTTSTIESTATPLDSTKIASLIEDAVTKASDASAKKVLDVVEKTDQARRLVDGIKEAVSEVLEESSVIEEAKPVLRKNLIGFATTNFKTLEAIDKVKLSEERDSVIKGLLELAQKITESKENDEEGEDDSGRKGKDKKKKSLFEFGVD